MTKKDYIESFRTETKKREMTYEQLSQLSGVPLSTIRKIMCGLTTEPRITTINKIASVFELEPLQNDTHKNEVVRSLNEIEKNSSFSVKDYKKSINVSIESLKNLRKALVFKYSQRELARVSGISYATINNIKKDTIPAQKTLKKLYQAHEYETTDTYYDREILDAIFEQKEKEPTVESYLKTIETAISSINEMLETLQKLEDELTKKGSN